jgi:predicted amidophosphoribosyltransferase
MSSPARTPIEHVAPYGGALRSLIRRLKYEGDTGAAPALAALLVEHLRQHYERASVDLIIPNPTHAARGVRHTETLLGAAAAVAGPRWRFDDSANPCLLKTGPTPTSHGKDRAGRQHAAAALYEVLVVARPELVAGRRLLIVDDVATTGAQVDAVAMRLREHGAAHVSALVLARPSRGRAVGDAGDSRPDRLTAGGGSLLASGHPVGASSLAIERQRIAARLDHLERMPTAPSLDISR